MPARPSRSRSRSRSSTSLPEDATEPNKGKGKAVRGRKPYPASRPPRDSVRPNKKGTPSGPSNSEPNGPSNPNQGRTLLMGTRLPVPPPMSRGSSSSSSSTSVKLDRSYPDLGMPSREEFAAMEEQYIASLDPRKQAKALISQAMFDSVWLALHNPRDNTIGSPQFRWWVRKMFVLARQDEFGVLVPFIADPDSDEAERGGVSFASYGPPREDGRAQEAMVMTGAPYLNSTRPLPVVLHDGKRVAIREQIYDILCVCHQRVGHGGRDKTATEIRKTYTWVPKDLIALFVKNCPTCMCKRSKQVERGVDNGPSPEALSSGSGSPTSEEESQATPVAQYVPLPMSNLIGGSQSGFGHVSPLGLPVWSHSPHSAPLPPPSSVVSGHGLSGSPPWYFPPGAAVPSGSGYFFLPQGMYAAPFLQRPHSQPSDPVQLPSIRVTDADGPGVGAHHPHSKVTLPSLSQVLSGELTAARIRQPLQTLSGNSGFDPLQVNSNSSPLRRGSHGDHLGGQQLQGAPYVPVIDPALLAQDGVHMLAMAAEVAQRGR